MKDFSKLSGDGLSGATTVKTVTITTITNRITDTTGQDWAEGRGRG